MNKPNVLIIADEKDSEILDTEHKSEHWNIFWEVIDYNELHKKVSEIRELVTKNNIDFVLYSRNDQVANRISIGPVTRKLRTGYSSFSGIDKKDRIKQMKVCFEAFVECNKRMAFNIGERDENLPESNSKGGTFSLIFDTEQLGGVKYGLPRILELLKRYDVRATFFVTNVVKKVYSNILEEIQRRRHEVGIHGKWHEYLSKYDMEEQRILIKSMVKDLGCQIYGANFMGRMNQDTIHALIENEIEYFVHPMINYYRFFCYEKLPTNPFLVSSEDEEIWMFPVSVETYNRPWLSIKNMINSAFLENLKSIRHVTILLHPFRDGNIQHINVTEILLRYLVYKKGLKGVPIKDILLNHKTHANVCKIKINKIDSLRESRFIPRTKEDFICMIPENLMMLWRIIKKDHAVW